MSRPITNPTRDDLQSVLSEPVEIHVEPGEEGVAQVSLYRGILEYDGGHWYVRAFGGFNVLHYREQRAWELIRRLEPGELTPDEQQAWMAFEPIAVMVYAHIEADASDRISLF